MERRIEEEQDAWRISTKTLLQSTLKQVNIVVKFELISYSCHASDFAPRSVKG